MVKVSSWCVRYLLVTMFVYQGVIPTWCSAIGLLKTYGKYFDESPRFLIHLLLTDLSHHHTLITPNPKPFSGWSWKCGMKSRKTILLVLDLFSFSRILSRVKKGFAEIYRALSLRKCHGGVLMWYIYKSSIFNNAVISEKSRNQVI